MNEVWKTFLQGQQVLVAKGHPTIISGYESNSYKRIYPLNHLAVLKITGKDAAKLLQGQLTCNVNEIKDTKGSFAALCNPKGRVIATFLLVKMADIFLMVFPVEMLETVRKRLQMFVLRSDVVIADASDELCIVGWVEPNEPLQPFLTQQQPGFIAVNFHGQISRKLLIADADNAISLWSGYVNDQGFRVGSSDAWRYLDIISGIPWVTMASSEEFIPQMLNLDKLGGISFNKGCYTGQEIVARTHYLGKSKRELFLAECDISNPPEPNSSIVNKESREVVGKVLQAQQDQQGCKLLVVLQTTETDYKNLGLQNDNLTTINLTPFIYG